MFSIIVRLDKPVKKWYAKMMYTKDDYILVSYSRKSEKQARRNVIKRFRNRKNGNLFLQPIISEYRKKHVSNI